MADKQASRKPATRTTGGKAPRAAKPEPESVNAKPELASVRARPFPIVGIGASAGGLEAFEQFFRHVDADSGQAYVLVSHLDPGHGSLLTEILQRATNLPVVEARDQLKVEPNHVYVIPPNRDMTIFHGALQLSMPEQPRGLRMPIDVFLRSLAEDQEEYAIGIVLSGTGSDGTLGLRAILGAGGVSLVQEPASAKYDGMPTSAIQAGYATHVLLAENMPAALLSDLRHALVHPQALSAADAGGLNRILMAVRSSTGHDFSLYKKSTIGRRIERRMALHNIDDTALYACYLKEHPAEVQALFKELLINVTSFFRDADAFLALKHDILPGLLADKPESYVFRAWVAGCSTGEEAYSLAMLLREYQDETGQSCKIQLYATDIDDDAIATARAGVYPPNIAQDVTPERLRRFFSKEDAGYRVKKNIREMVVFAIQNIIKDPPFTKLDLLSCRNLMIYLEPELQNRLVAAFHYALKPGGVLFLSSSEGIGSHSELFTPLSRKWRLYRAVPSAAPTRALLTSGLSWATESKGRAPDAVLKRSKDLNFAELTRRALLQSYAPASVVTDLAGNILYVYGETSKYLRLAPGQAAFNVVDMAREGLQLELRAALGSAANQKLPTLCRELLVHADGKWMTISLSVRSLAGADPEAGLLLISFQDVAHPVPDKSPGSRRGATPAQLRRIEELERDLAYTRENLQAMIEEQQATNEELKSANEEMQSTNEELQSTNEELETSKEELQSVNEELITVNAELQSKIEQLAGVQNDMKNLLDNIGVGTVFLDQHLAIRRFTREAVRVYRLVATDVGRFLGDIRSNLDGGDLLAEAQAVLESLTPHERLVRSVDGNSFLASIQPYRTLDNAIDGVVLSFTDITLRVAAEAAVRELATAIVDTVREPLLVLDGALQVVSASRSFYRYFQVNEADTVGRPVHELGNRQWDIPALRELLGVLLLRDESFEDYPVTHDFPQIGTRTLMLNARRVPGATPLILLAMDIPPPPA